ncbi:MAG TPA: UDP-N-acetylmuramoyl-L-alanyl-D-glutamate--2,6-diaminopimelate ligase [Geobacteraceae bacterium]|nr:UDP-N-acetylmuramoyl-L-alanyl-D-glutamate--2,6-diaminopimelate ligase [Geobacteraceae bacterium]
MYFSELLQLIEPLKIHGDTRIEIQGLSYDSRQAGSGDLFFALRGSAADGHLYVGSALANGATAVVVEDEAVVPAGVPYAVVEDARLAMSIMAAGFYGNPTDGLPLVGITGTNGKTTTSYIIEAILEEAGISAALLGTVNYRFRERVFPAPNTTPESVDLQKRLREMADLGARGVVMEVSSHALEQRRVDGCRFDAGVFTNLTRDHLDYHGDMDSYLASKKRLFTALLSGDRVKPRRRAVINADDPYGREIAAEAACPVITFGLDPASQVTARDPRFSVGGITARLVTPVGDMPFRSRLAGRFNMYNILAAAAAGVALELPLRAIISGIEGHRKVPGRLETVENDRGIAVFVDYAHTGDALENVLRTLSELAGGRIITVFGCGGDRDRGKRPVMGEVAGRYSDLVIITSDNPRSEQPGAIMAEIRGGILGLGTREYSAVEVTAGFTEKGFVLIESRREAIRLAVRLAQPGDIVILAGKGHEDYQIIGAERIHFDDREEAAAALNSEL